MFKRTNTWPPFMLLLALSACGPADSELGPGGISVEDAKALDEAAAKLDAEAQQVPQK